MYSTTQNSNTIVVVAQTRQNIGSAYFIEAKDDAKEVTYFT